MKIKYSMYGKSFEEDVQDVVIFDEKGKNRLYAYTTQDGGICIITPFEKKSPGKTIFVSGEGYKI